MVSPGSALRDLDTDGLDVRVVVSTDEPARALIDQGASPTCSLSAHEGTAGSTASRRRSSTSDGATWYSAERN